MGEIQKLVAVGTRQMAHSFLSRRFSTYSLENEWQGKHISYSIISIFSRRFSRPLARLSVLTVISKVAEQTYLLVFSIHVTRLKDFSRLPYCLRLLGSLSMHSQSTLSARNPLLQNPSSAKRKDARQRF